MPHAPEPKPVFITNKPQGFFRQQHSSHLASGARATMPVTRVPGLRQRDKTNVVHALDERLPVGMRRCWSCATPSGSRPWTPSSPHHGCLAIFHAPRFNGRFVFLFLPAPCPMLAEPASLRGSAGRRPGVRVLLAAPPASLTEAWGDFVVSDGSGLGSIMYDLEATCTMP